MPFSCPLCHSPLQRRESAFVCPQGHQFDLAKEGYVNLLPVQHKRSRDPGDSAEMMQARRAFLDAGHYLPLREAVGVLLQARLPEQAAAMLDIGCGEGYYTARPLLRLPVTRAQKRLGWMSPGPRSARRQNVIRSVTFCVASSHRLPFDDASMDAVIRIYAPCKAEELARVVKPGGWVVTVTPGPRHLMELKGLIYDEVRLHAPLNNAGAMDGFKAGANSRAGV